MFRKLAVFIVGFVVSMQVATARLEYFGGRPVNIEYWAGTGSSRAVCVVDFGPKAFAFGYRWDGVATGFDMLAAIDAAGELAMVYNTDFGSPYVDTISYKGHTAGAYFGYPSDWLTYHVSPYGSIWSLAPVGAADRQLDDGDWDAWAAQTSADYPPAHTPQTSPSASILVEGIEYRPFSVIRVNGNWINQKPSFNRVVAMLHHDGPEGNTLNIAGITLHDNIVTLRDKMPEPVVITPGCTLTYTGERFTGRFELTDGADRTTGRLRGTGTPGNVETLFGLLSCLERTTGGKVEGLSFYIWALSGLKDID